MSAREPFVTLVGDAQDCTVVAKFLPAPRGTPQVVNVVLQQAPADGLPPQAIHLNFETSALLELGMFFACLCSEATANLKPASPVQRGVKADRKPRGRAKGAGG